MKKASFVTASYQDSITINHQGNRDSIKTYLNQGYRITQSRNGFQVLTKPVEILVYLKNSNNIILSFNMKEDILKYYNKTRISHSLFDKFVKDSQTGNIEFYMDNNSYCFN